MKWTKDMDRVDKNKGESVYESKVIYCLYDSRYSSNPDDAVLYTVEKSLKAAKREKRESFTDAVIVKEACSVNDKGGLTVINSEIISI